MARTQPQPAHVTFIQGDKLQTALECFLLSRQSSRCTPATIKFYRNLLTVFLGWLRNHGVTQPIDITSHHIRLYLVYLQERGLRDSSQHAHARAIKAWLRWLVLEDELDHNPMDRVSMPRVDKALPTVFTVEDIRLLLDACNRRTVMGVRNYAIILCLLDSGLRRAEFAGMRLSDVNLKTGIVFVRRGKGGKQRQTRLGLKARGALLRHLANVPDLQPNERLFGLTPRGVQIMLYRLGKRAGVVPCCAQQFRRTFATWMLREGVDLHSLRVLMGHSDLSVLQRYLALGAQDIERVHVAHSPADNWL